jgi:hypothetical protein
MKLGFFILRITVPVSLLLLITGLQPVTAGSLSPQATIQVTTHLGEYNQVKWGSGCALREAIQAANTDTAFGGSPAIDAADPANTLTRDQRGFTRPVGGACDIGAFVFQIIIFFLPLIVN